MESVCPGCGLVMPADKSLIYDGYYNTSDECWSVYTEVLRTEFANAFLFGQVHQLTVDTYAVQHAGGKHKDQSVTVHLAGLYLVLERGYHPTTLHKYFRQLAEHVNDWPHFEVPATTTETSVLDVGFVESTVAHIKFVEEWAVQVWRAWSPHHQELKVFLHSHLGDI